MGKLLNISVRDGFVNNGADVPVKEVLALSVGTWIVGFGATSNASGIASSL